MSVGSRSDPSAGPEHDVRPGAAFLHRAFSGQNAAGRIFQALIKRFDGIELPDSRLRWCGSLGFGGLRHLQLRFIEKGRLTCM